MEFAKDAPAIPHPSVPEPELGEVNHAPPQPLSRVGTADLNGTRSRATTSDGQNLGSTGGVEGVEKEVLSKEEEEFLKLESTFITELGLSGSQLPTFARSAEDPATST